jgi:hypothetical protein
MIKGIIHVKWCGISRDDASRIDYPTFEISLMGRSPVVSRPEGIATAILMEDVASAEVFRTREGSGSSNPRAA